MTDEEIELRVQVALKTARRLIDEEQRDFEPMIDFMVAERKGPAVMLLNQVPRPIWTLAIKTAAHLLEAEGYLFMSEMWLSSAKNDAAGLPIPPGLRDPDDRDDCLMIGVQLQGQPPRILVHQIDDTPTGRHLRPEPHAMSGADGFKSDTFPKEW